ncbi:hypothetical protein Q5752_001139 [Cryptotrichosporon argae]
MGGCLSRPDYYEPQPHVYFYPPAQAYVPAPRSPPPAYTGSGLGLGGGKPKHVRFGVNPPEWEFSRSAAPRDNTMNTRFFIPPAGQAYYPSHADLARGRYRTR